MSGQIASFLKELGQLMNKHGVSEIEVIEGRAQGGDIQAIGIEFMYEGGFHKMDGMIFDADDFLMESEDFIGDEPEEEDEEESEMETVTLNGREYSYVVTEEDVAGMKVNIDVIDSDKKLIASIGIYKEFQIMNACLFIGNDGMVDFIEPFNPKNWKSDIFPKTYEEVVAFIVEIYNSRC